MRYLLMNKRTEVFEFETIGSTGFSVDRITDVFNSEYAPPELAIDDGVVDINSFSAWLSSRNIPASRQDLQKSMEVMQESVGNEVSVTQLAKQNYFLSLSDQYWICQSGSGLSWDTVNYFTNDFSPDVGRIMFDRTQVDTPSLMSPDISAAGYLSKKWIVENGDRYLIKASTPPYQQEAFNEEIASMICRRLNIDHTEYFAYTKNGESHCRCKCFIDENTELVPAKAILYKYYYNDQRVSKYELFKNTCKMMHIPDYKKSIDDMIVVDFIMGNEDRHYNNFGAVRDVNTLEYTGFAPLFDSGRSLRYNEDTNYIDTKADISCGKPFAKLHSEQIKLVTCPQRYELSKLRDLPEEAADMFYKSNYRYADRVKVIAELLGARIKMLDNALRTELYNGINVPKTKR